MACCGVQSGRSHSTLLWALLVIYEVNLAGLNARIELEVIVKPATNIIGFSFFRVSLASPSAELSKTNHVQLGGVRVKAVNQQLHEKI
jgi:hypothetical protein